MSVPAIDLKDPDLYIDGVPYALLADLRREAAVHWNPESDGAGFWSVLCYDDIVAISKDPETFSSAYEHGGHRIFNENERGVAELGAGTVGVPFISTDPPLHRWYRNAVLPGLKLARVREMGPRLKARIASLLDRVETLDGEFDFVRHIAAPFPLLTLAELFGVPADDIDRLYDWSNALVGEDDPSLRVSPEQTVALLGEMLDYASFIFDARRREPQDDILSMLAHGQLNGEPISRADFLGTFILLLVGGNETTRNSIAHGMVAFTANPAQWELLAARRELMSSAVREIVRYASPVFHMRRTATRDAVLGGQAIKAGQKVVMFYGAANRDASHFADPHALMLGRTPNEHMAFGNGPHVCLGQHLARLEMRLLWEELFSRLESFELDGEPKSMVANFVCGPKAVPVRYKMK